MKDEMRTAMCPLCGETYTGHSAISRSDNQTPICPDCGTKQALTAIGISEEEQEKILEIIHEHTGC